MFLHNAILQIKNNMVVIKYFIFIYSLFVREKQDRGKDLAQHYFDWTYIIDFSLLVNLFSNLIENRKLLLIL